jgi:hypothetical protein
MTENYEHPLTKEEVPWAIDLMMQYGGYSSQEELLEVLQADAADIADERQKQGDK